MMFCSQGLCKRLVWLACILSTMASVHFVLSPVSSVSFPDRPNSKKYTPPATSSRESPPLEVEARRTEEVTSQEEASGTPCDGGWADRCGQSPVYTQLEEALAAHASPERVVVLGSLVDHGNVDMAVNFHLLSVARHGICNVLYVCIAKEVVPSVARFHMPIYVYNGSVENTQAGDFASDAFNEKSQIKLWVTRQALYLGYTVLVSDVDIVFTANPLMRMLCTAPSCDLAMQDNTPDQTPTTFNSGFMYVHPTARAITFYDKMLTIKNWKGHDQALLNKVYRDGMVPGLNITALPSNLYCVGRVREEEQARQCIVYHANYIVSLSRKVFRLQKFGMWALGNKRAADYVCT